MKWLKNLKVFALEGKVGDCPYCRSEDTDYMYYKRTDMRSYLEMWCNSCDERIHIDCGSVPPNRKYKSAEKASEFEREKIVAN